MTAEALTSLPFSAGGAVAAAAGRAALWGLSAYMQAPLRNTALAALVTLSAMAGSNALYRQAHHHPAPLFGAFEATPVAKADPRPVMPASRPQTATSSAAAPARLALPQPTARALTRDDILEAQRKLESLGLFSGKVDGFYGPKTATAIKAFEQDLGLPARGELTADILARLRSTTPTPKPAFATPSKPAAAAPARLAVTSAAAPAPLALTTPARSAPAVEAAATLASAESEAKLPAPAPLSTAAAAPAPTTTASVGEAAIAPLDDMPAASNVAKRSVQTIAVRAQSAPAPAPAQAMPPELTVPAGGNAATDPQIVAAVQRGLTSLGFLHGEVDGVAGEATAKAIRNFEVYFNYDVTGRITPELVKLLVQNGGVI